MSRLKPFTPSIKTFILVVAGRPLGKLTRPKMTMPPPCRIAAPANEAPPNNSVKLAKTNNPLRLKEPGLGRRDRRAAIVSPQQNRGLKTCCNPQAIGSLLNQRLVRRKSSPQAE